MSYTQIDAGGKLRGLKFNQLALEKLSQYAKGDDNLIYAYAIFYAGLFANCYVKREEPDFTFEQACDWFDELKEEDIIKVNAAFQDSIAYQKLLPKEETKKKKVKKNTGANV